MKTTVSLLLLCSLSLLLRAQSKPSVGRVNFNLQAAPKYETRAVWLTTLANLDWPRTYATSVQTRLRQKKELTDMLDRLAAANINTVLLQVRVRSTVIYPSAIEPWDRCLTGRFNGFPGYDPLRFAIEECHRRGMELHAWVATMPAGEWNSPGCRRLAAKGCSVRRLPTGAYLNPDDSRTASYLATICGEIAERYDIDGISLDYIRYPDGWPRASGKHGDTPERRRGNITRIVRAIHDRVKAVKPWVRMSCSPIGKYADLARYSSKGYNARDRVYQDARIWLQTGLMDQLFPMQYFRGDGYYPFCADWVENSCGREVVSGLGTYFLSPREGNWTIGELARQMSVSRSLGMGHAHFRAGFLLADLQGVYSHERIFNTSAAMPATLSAAGESAPSTPTPLFAAGRLSALHGCLTVFRWDGDAPYYNVYMSDRYPVDITDARNLVAARLTRKSFYIRTAGGQPSCRHFAITAMDRMGNESAALQEPRAAAGAIASRMMANDGRTLVLPAGARQADADYYAAESTPGQGLRILRIVRNDTLDISSLPAGVYVLRSCSARRKKSHRMGCFAVRRRP